jgi:site-specific DNA-methyltransferase (adenine-specific)
VEIVIAEVKHGDCLAVLAEMPDASIDAVVTDPPYGLAFMGKRWDYDVPAVEVWRECLRVLKPGGHLLAFAGTRTQHRMAVRIEDAGFEIRDMIAWVYGSGFPKSLDVSKAIDKAAGAEREVIGPNKWAERGGLVQANTYGAPSRPEDTAPATPEAHQWQGWGTALKPALEPITVARKPLAGTVAANVLEHGTGALNVDGCRVGTDESLGRPLSSRPEASSINAYNWSTRPNPLAGEFLDNTKGLGRWPANLIHDGSDEVVGLLGSAARFFYCAKASKRDRDEGLEGFEVKQATGGGGGVGDSLADVDSASGKFGSEKAPARNHHPTVKPTDLMRYLCRLVTPPGGVVLDPFCGSGSTGKAAVLEGFNFIGIEREAEYVEIARARIAAAAASRGLF